MKIERLGHYAPGSFGLPTRHNEQRTVVPVWTCGRRRNGPDNKPCVHSSREEARECRRRSTKVPT